ncbi:MAG: hypothetical protein HYW28_09815 [Rhodospirillales bacterium]|nr:hypothetical protein [Rhodospirillales bacterium]
MKLLHGYVNDPTIYLSLILVGTLLIAYTGSIWISDFRLKHAGGISGREFEARLQHWDRIEKFTVWQTAWLWHGLEPQESKSPTEGTPAYPAFRWLQECLKRGDFKDAAKVNNSWSWTILSRQELIDHALKTGERPKFLFSENRSAFRRLIQKILDFRDVNFNEAEKWQSMSRFEYQVDQYLREQNGESDQEKSFDVAMLAARFGGDKFEDRWKRKNALIRNLMWLGEYEAIGRRLKNNLCFEYERIPAWQWEFIEISFPGLKYINECFQDVRVRRNPKLERAHGAG